MARRHISELRQPPQLRRKANLRQPRSITLIVCEGETEQRYFEAVRLHLRLTNAEVVIGDNRNASAPISIVDFAESKCKERGGYDKVFCVFDKDMHESFERARRKITELRTRASDALPIYEIVSIPCFEVWVLLHHERSDRPFDRCTDVVARIRNNYIADYTKADDSVVLDLMARISTAEQNAVWLAARAHENGFNPYTTVHVLVQHLKGVADPVQ